MTVRSGRVGAGAARRYRASFQDEIDSASVYRAIADVETSPQLAEVYRNLAEAEERHADFWAGQLHSGGRQVVIGLGAAAPTFGVGRVIGVAVVG